jgi:acetyl esterase/lipase
VRTVLLGAALTFLPACGLVERVGVGILGERADLSDARVLRDRSYGPDPRQKLDLYLPDRPGSAVLVFVHGGGWNTGDKDLRAGGLDVYANIGRFYAARGILTAVINYRLMYGVSWRDQVEDAARATSWVRDNAPAHGGDPARLFVMGHSAGAYLASHVALNQGLQAHVGLPPGSVRGLVAASGAALDLLDDTTYVTEDVRYYEKRFGPRDKAAWSAASPATHIDADDPPALVLVTTGESKGLRRQARVFHDKLVAAGVQTGFTAVPGESHSRMVLVLSHPEKTATPEILAFINEARENP